MQNENKEVQTEDVIFSVKCANAHFPTYIAVFIQHFSSQWENSWPDFIGISST